MKRRRARAATLLVLLASIASAVLIVGCGSTDEQGELETIATSGHALRPDSPGNNDLYRFDPGDVVETFASTGGLFLVHFTRQGPNAVPSADADGGGVPDFVEEVAGIYDEVQAYYEGTLGFRSPPSDEAASVENGGDGRFDVYLVDFNGKGDGVFRNDGCLDDEPQICAGYMVQENDYKGYGYPSTKIANRILGSHEFFHAVQSAYDTDQDSVLREGTAVWATEAFDPSLKDFEGFIKAYLENADRTLNEPLPGPVDPFSYGSALFFQFMDERFGAEIIRALLERCENGSNGVADPYWYDELDPLLAKESGSSFAEAFTNFAEWNLFTGDLADPARSYAAGSGYPSLQFRDVTAPFSDDRLRVFRASTQYYRMAPAGRAKMSAALVASKDAPDAADGLAMLLAVVRGSSLDPVVRVAEPSKGVETIDTGGADSVIVVIVNTAQEGSSRQPGLCVGTSEEVEACRKALVPTDPDTPSDPPPATPPQEQSTVKGGCACDIYPPVPALDALELWPLAGVLLALARRRARSSARPATARTRTARIG